MVSKLSKGKTYYVKVRAYKKDSTGAKVYGSFSSVKKVKISKYPKKYIYNICHVVKT